MTYWLTDVHFAINIFYHQLGIYPINHHFNEIFSHNKRLSMINKFYFLSFYEKHFAKSRLPAHESA